MGIMFIIDQFPGYNLNARRFSIFREIDPQTMRKRAVFFAKGEVVKILEHIEYTIAGLLDKISVDPDFITSFISIGTPLVFSIASEKASIKGNNSAGNYV